ncbi:DUF2786 domain-containing protein [Actinomadura sp. KC345]|uniref:DUF2786 domain-containing protein n=1 Tax=Actinomadura sp. KC345 TaxID=2530371 RepID=UPI00104EFC49|nr:DUF2786 domain-containing protein [Actinomadura sp. KC345]TDC42256.1 DUF2786 domain-containing protein [Actinomadura sp. KC345]
MRNARRRSQPGGTAGAAGAASLAEAADELVGRAVGALRLGDAAGARRSAAELTGRSGVPGWTLAVHRCLAVRLRCAITTAWQRGWQPADVVGFASRRRTARHGRLAADAIAGEMRAYPGTTVDDRWREQLAAVGAEVWWDTDDGYPDAWCEREGVEHALYVPWAVELVQLLESLPRLPSLGPPPGTSGTGASRRTDSPGAEVPERGGAVPHERVRDVDQRTLGRVRALLAKAESTEFPEEAEALSARAQELMARHSIDDALLAAETGDIGGPAGRRIAVDNPYDSPKAALLTVVAGANRCRAVWHRELGLATVVGYPADLAAVEMMFTSLLVQATSAMVHAGPRRDARGRSRTRSFRHAFLNAYAARIGERLREAADRATAGARGTVLVPVLAARDRAVDEAVGTMFPNLAKGRAGSVSNYEGWVAGRAAADLASLNDRLGVTGAHDRS